MSREDAKEIAAPMVAGAATRIECGISRVVDMGYSSLLIPNVLHDEVRKDYFAGGTWNFSGDLELIHHLGGTEFAVSGRSLEVSE